MFRLKRPFARSLAARLVVSATAWSAVSLVAAGILLTEVYRASLERSFDARLVVYQKALSGALAASSDGEAPALGNLGEPRFLIPLTGWYWIVRDEKGGIVGTSSSLFGEELEVMPPSADGRVASGYGVGPAGEELRVVTQRVRLGGGPAYDVIVTGGTSEITADIATFRFQVFLTLLVFGLGLIIATVLQVKLALRPLDSMRTSLAAIRQGRASRLEGDFPSEIAPLGQELNALIETNGAIVERARAHVGNLAHALKTPLSVMLNEARADRAGLSVKVEEQVGVMKAVVDRYLDRARMAAQRRVIGASSRVMRSVDAIARVLRQAYPEKQLRIETSGPETLSTRVERRDLDELVGNLMDNACKYGRGHVRVTVRPDGDAASDRPMLTLVVEDNGPGLPADQVKEALSRGKRLDETVPGSGLGLSIVDEIVESYGGQLALGPGSLGGLAVTLHLPQS